MSKALTAAQIRAHLNRLAIMRDVKINKSTNPTVPAVLRRILHSSKTCEDCPRKVKNRVVTAHVVFYPTRHWLQKCMKCMCFLNRRTGLYDLTWQTAHAYTLVDMGHYRNNKPQSQSITERRNIQLYRNWCQSERLALTNKNKNKDK